MDLCVVSKNTHMTVIFDSMLIECFTINWMQLAKTDDFQLHPSCYLILFVSLASYQDGFWSGLFYLSLITNLYTNRQSIFFSDPLLLWHCRCRATQGVSITSVRTSSVYITCVPVFQHVCMVDHILRELMPAGWIDVQSSYLLQLLWL